MCLSIWLEIFLALFLFADGSACVCRSDSPGHLEEKVSQLEGMLKKLQDDLQKVLWLPWILYSVIMFSLSSTREPAGRKTYLSRFSFCRRGKISCLPMQTCLQMLPSVQPLQVTADSLQRRIKSKNTLKMHLFIYSFVYRNIWIRILKYPRVKNVFFCWL